MRQRVRIAYGSVNEAIAPYDGPALTSGNLDQSARSEGFEPPTF